MKTTERGVTLIEMIVYIFILVFVVLVVISMLIVLGKSYREIKSAEAIEVSAQAALDRMVREIHDAKSVDVTQSFLNATSGKLMLNTTDAQGGNATIQFLLSSTTIRIKENAIDSGPLSASSTNVTALIFRLVTGAQSQAVKIEMAIESGTSTAYRSNHFYDTAVLRGSYSNQ